MFRGAFDPITTRQSFIDEVQVYSDDDADAADPRFNLTGCTIQASIADQWPGYWSGSRTNPIPYYDGSRSPVPLLTASTVDGTIVIPDLGVFVFTFTPAQIATLIPGQYVIGATIARDDEVTQLILGDLSVLDGVVPQ